MQCNAYKQCNAMHISNTMQCISAIQCNAYKQCNAMYISNVMQCIYSMECNAMLSNVMHIGNAYKQ